MATAPIIRLFELLTDGGEVANLSTPVEKAETRRFKYPPQLKTLRRREKAPQSLSGGPTILYHELSRN